MATLRDLLPGQWITLLGEMTGEGMRPIWQRHAKLTPWLPDVENTLKAIAEASRHAAPEEPPAAPVPSRLLDRRVEASVRVFYYFFKVLQNFWVAMAQEDKALKVEEAEHFVFDRGLSFLSASYGAQVGETTRMLTLARHESVRSALGPLTLAGHDYDGLLALAERNNEALNERVKAEATAPARPQPTPELVVRGAVSLIVDLLPVIERALSDDDEALALDRRTLMAPLNRELDVAARRIRLGLSPIPPAPPSDPILP